MEKGTSLPIEKDTHNYLLMIYENHRFQDSVVSYN